LGIWKRRRVEGENMRSKKRNDKVTNYAIALVIILLISAAMYYSDFIPKYVLNTQHKLVIYTPSGKGDIRVSALDLNYVEWSGDTDFSPIFSTPTNQQPYYVDHGRQIRIRATPAAGYAFDRWIVDEGKAVFGRSLSLYMIRDHFVQPRFKAGSSDTQDPSTPVQPEQPEYTPPSSKTVRAYSSPDGVGRIEITKNLSNDRVSIDSGKTYYYYSGRTVKLWAFPDSGWTFESWLITAGGKTFAKYDNPLSIMMDKDYVIQGRFKVPYTPKPPTTTTTTPQLPILISFCVEGEGGFWNFADQLKQYKFSSGRYVNNKCTDYALPAKTYSGGTRVSLVAEPASGWRFVRYEGLVKSTNPKTNFEVTQDMRLGTIRCVFEPIPIQTGDIIDLKVVELESSLDTKSFDGKTYQGIETGKHTKVKLKFLIKNIHDRPAQFSLMLQTRSDRGHIGERIYEPHIGSKSGDWSRDWRSINAGEEKWFVHEIEIGEYGAKVSSSIYAKLDNRVFEKTNAQFRVVAR
jgi:hypothetical protein